MTTRNFLSVGIGYQPDYIGAPVYNRTGATLAVGELVMVDMLAGDAGFGGNASAALYLAQPIGNELHPLAQVLTPTTAGIGALSASAGVIFGVVDDVMAGGGADDTLIHVCWKGLVKIKMAGTAASGEFGKPILGANGVRTVTTTVTVGVKQLGKVLADATTANSNSLCLFNGVEGFGGSAAS
jgi:hypothetical protein